MSRKEPIVNDIVYSGKKIRLLFYDGDDAGEFMPYTQSYAIPFTEDGKIVIGKASHKTYNDWQINGGTIEKGENPEDTIARELDEELSLEIIRLKLLGAQLVEHLEADKPKKYQLRYVALVRLKDLNPDPDGGVFWERKVVKPEEFSKYVQWGNIGEHLLRKGYAQYLKWSNRHK